MALASPVRRRDVFRRGYVFRSTVTGAHVSRLFALLNRNFTVKEKVR